MKESQEHLKYRVGSFSDINQLVELAVASWQVYESALTPENWQALYSKLIDPNNFKNLLNQSYCLVCENEANKIVGMAYLVPKGNPTDIYKLTWSYIRFLSVSPTYGGQGIGRALTEKCIAHAKATNEEVVALHTSEMMTKAMRLYEDLGFEKYKEIPPRLGKRYWVYLLDIN